MKGTWKAAAAICLAAAGCKGTCLDAGEKVSVEVRAAANLNDSQGSGPQHVKYRVWALNDVTTFEALAAQPDGAAALADPAQDAARVGQGFGLPMSAPNGGWIAPGTNQTVAPLAATVDKQFAAIGIVVLFGQPKSAVVAIDCGEHDGYAEKKGVHEVTFQLDGTAVAPAKPPATPVPAK
jgi:predicted component of type VI protein secretion system